MHRGQIRSKTDGMNRRKSIWACAHCRAWYEAKPGKICVSCGCAQMHYFPSKAEAKRFAELCLLLDHGRISELEVQPSYPMVINDLKITVYRADFKYLDSDGRQVIEDVKPKSFRTDLYRLKKKLVEAIYTLTITEVTP